MSVQTTTDRALGDRVPPALADYYRAIDATRFDEAVSAFADDVLYAGRNRLHVSRDGGIFWRALGVELPEIRDVAWG